MKIALVGVFTPDSSNLYMAQSLTRLGHHVIGIPYREYISQGGLKAIHQALHRAEKAADAIVICKGCGAPFPPIQADVVKALSCNTLYWMPDSTDVAGPETVALAKACLNQSATSLVSCQRFLQEGCRNVNQVFEGTPPEVFHPIPGLRKTWDVLWKGSVTGRCEKHIQALQDAGIALEMPKGYVSCEVMNEYYGRSKVVLNFAWGEIFSGRVFDVLASGSFLLTQACADLPAGFGLGADSLMVFDYMDAAERLLPDRIRSWLTNDEARERVAAQGREAVKPFTWDAQMAKMVKVLQGEKVYDGAFKGGAA